jgi:hypothetical protein
MDSDLAMDLSRILVTPDSRARDHDEERSISSVPHGISRADVLAAFFDEGCPFCEGKVDVVEESEPDEDCECCAMLVREWRAEHADALRRFEAARAKGSRRATACSRSR